MLVLIMNLSWKAHTELCMPCGTGEKRLVVAPPGDVMYCRAEKYENTALLVVLCWEGLKDYNPLVVMCCTTILGGMNNL